MEKKIITILNNLSFLIGFILSSPYSSFPVDDWRGFDLIPFFARLMNEKGLRVEFNNYLRNEMLCCLAGEWVESLKVATPQILYSKRKLLWRNECSPSALQLKFIKCVMKITTTVEKYKNIIKSMFILTFQVLMKIWKFFISRSSTKYEKNCHFRLVSVFFWVNHMMMMMTFHILARATHSYDYECMWMRQKILNEGKKPFALVTETHQFPKKQTRRFTFFRRTRKRGGKN